MVLYFLYNEVRLSIPSSQIRNIDVTALDVYQPHATVIRPLARLNRSGSSNGYSPQHIDLGDAVQ
jgi:hypothetical protein